MYSDFRTNGFRIPWSLPQLLLSHPSYGALVGLVVVVDRVALRLEEAGCAAHKHRLRKTHMCAHQTVLPFSIIWD